MRSEFFVEEKGECVKLIPVEGKVPETKPKTYTPL